MKMKVLAIAIVIGLAITGLTYFAEVTYDQSIQNTFYGLSDGSLNIVISNSSSVQNDASRGLLFTYFVISGNQTIFSPLAFFIDFIVFFVIAFAIVFFMFWSAEKRKAAYHMRMQQLHYSRRKIRRR